MIDELARTEKLLIASDFDGTVAEIVDDPDLATPLTRSKAALEALAGMEGTNVAIISGRRRSELGERFDEGSFILIGEHGADQGAAAPPATMAMSRARELVDAVAAVTPGSRAEHKSRSVAFHFRTVDNPGPVVANLRRRALTIDGIRLVEGKMVLELTESSINKGMALEALARSLEVDRVLFMGDDDTDETGFAVLREQDVGVHVGLGPTRAGVKVGTPSELADLLDNLVTARRRHLAAGSAAGDGS